MKIKAIDHITINVVDLEESIRFYGEILGLEQLNSVDMGDHVLRYFRLTDETRLELITYQDPLPPMQCRAVQPGVYRHFAVEVEDIGELRARLESCGVVIRMQPSPIEKLGAVCMLVEDPNGVEIEVTEKF